MARDYKHRATSRKRRKQVSPWLGMTVGLLVGLFVAFPNLSSVDLMLLALIISL